MKLILVTYGDTLFEPSKKRFVQQAENIGIFDKVVAFSPEEVSTEIKTLPTWGIKRGGGLWTWKPDIILQTLNQFEDGDIVIYADAGCSVYPTKEWKKYKKILSKYDIVAQRIFQRTDHWTRRELLDAFLPSNGCNWPKLYQYQATVFMRVSDFSKMFLYQWIELIKNHPVYVMDVTDEEKAFQHPTFVENRHDQAVYSALVYKFLNDKKYSNHIYTCWEHIEDYDPFHHQALRATRLRNGEQEEIPKKIIRAVKFMIKKYIYKPFWYGPLQWWYNRSNY